jgi:hypothetical protein
LSAVPADTKLDASRKQHFPLVLRQHRDEFEAPTSPSSYASCMLMAVGATCNRSAAAAAPPASTIAQK